MKNKIKRLIRFLYYRLPPKLSQRYLLPCRNYVFEVTYHCNLDCSMCCYLQEIQRMQSEITPRQELTTNQIIDIVRRFPPHSNIAFTGGEPFTKKGFIAVVKAAKAAGHTVTIGTNGVLLTPELCAELVALKVDQVGFSIDGPRELHNTIRRRPTAFDGVTAAIATLRAARSAAGSAVPRIFTNAVILPQNAAVLSETIRVMKESGADVASLEALDGSYERSASRLKESIDPDTDPLGTIPVINGDLLRASLTTAITTAQEIGIDLVFSPSGMSVDDLVDYYNHSFCRDGWYCTLPWDTCRISPYGDLFPCMNYRIGSVREFSLYNLWSSVRYGAFRKLFRGGRLRACCTGCCKMRKMRAGKKG